MPTTIKTELATALKRGSCQGFKLDAADRAFLKRWVDYEADNPIWEKIVADARNINIWPPESIHSTVIWYALQARRVAKSVKGGDDPFVSERQEQRKELLALAEKADHLARYFKEVEKYPGIADFFQRFLVWPVTPEQEAVPRIEFSFFRVRQLREVHEQEAKLLRERAGREPRPTTRISRQTGGKNKRSRSREYIAFMALMVSQMRELCSKPHYYAVSVITNNAFPAADVTTDEVRAACRPTTKLGRRSKTGTLSQ